MKNAVSWLGLLVSTVCFAGVAQAQPSAQSLAGEWRVQEQMESNVAAWPIRCENTGTLRLTWENGALTGQMRMGPVRCRYPRGTYSGTAYEQRISVGYLPSALSFSPVEGCPYAATVAVDGTAMRGTFECTMEDEGGEPMRVYGQWQATRDRPSTAPPPAAARPASGARAPHICGGSGRFAVFAFRPLSDAPVMVVPSPRESNHQIAHEQLFFCNGGVVVENMGFMGIDKPLNGRGAMIVETPASFPRYEVRDPTRYDYDVMSRVVGERLCQAARYDLRNRNCQHWADEQRRRYREAMAERQPRRKPTLQR